MKFLELKSFTFSMKTQEKKKFQSFIIAILCFLMYFSHINCGNIQWIWFQILFLNKSRLLLKKFTPTLVRASNSTTKKTKKKAENSLGCWCGCCITRLFWYLKAVKASFLSPWYTTIGLLCLLTMTKKYEKSAN